MNAAGLYALLMIATIIALGWVGKWSNLEPGQLMQWSLALFLFALEMAFIFLIWIGTRPRRPNDYAPIGINLEKLISEQDGSASFSRFQFLIFTFVVASGYVVQVFMTLSKNADRLPEIPGGVLALIGISGGSYLVSKGIEKSVPGPAAPGGATPPALPGEAYRP